MLLTPVHSYTKGNILLYINYIVYNDGTRDFRDEEEIFASRYTVEDGNFILSDIEYDYEWDLIDNMLESKYKEID